MPDYNDKTVFLGIDVHKKTYSVKAVCEGCVVKQDTFVASLEMIARY